MKARVAWRGQSERRGLRALEWILLLMGLAAVDCFVWINTSSVLYQSYQDWAFDQTLRGLTPSLTSFAGDEARRLLGGGRREKTETAEAPLAPSQSNQAHAAVPAAQAVIGRLQIPRLKLAVMVR